MAGHANLKCELSIFLFLGVSLHAKYYNTFSINSKTVTDKLIQQTDWPGSMSQ